MLGPSGDTPKDPCSGIVDTWALNVLLDDDFGTYVHTIVVPGLLGCC